MMRLGTGSSLFTLLGLGTADLALLNLWAMPALLAGPELEPPAKQASPAVETAPANPGYAPSASQPPSIAIRPDPEARAAELASTDQASTSAAGGLRSAPTARPEPSEPAPRREPAEMMATAPTLHFGRGSWWLDQHERDALAEIARHSDPSTVIEVQGHADPSGPRELNQRISEERARAVADLLMQFGIGPDRIRVRAFGEDRPSATGRDRRVEIALRGER